MGHRRLTERDGRVVVKKSFIWSSTNRRKVMKMKLGTVSRMTMSPGKMKMRFTDGTAVVLEGETAAVFRGLEELERANVDDQCWEASQYAGHVADALYARRQMS